MLRLMSKTSKTYEKFSFNHNITIVAGVQFCEAKCLNKIMTAEVCIETFTVVT